LIRILTTRPAASASTTEALPNGPTVVLNYQYNPAGQRTEMAVTIDGVPDFVDDYSYNAAGQVISVTEHGVTGGDAVANKEIDLSYNADGELATVDRYQDGVLAVEGDYTYDSAGDLTGLVYHQGDTVLASYAWTYSGGTVVSGQWSVGSEGNWQPTGGIVPVHDTTGVTSALMSSGFAGLAEVTSCTSVDGTANYSYDPTGELLAATYSGGQVNEAYSYDANGNRTNAGYATGADNRLLSDGTYTYAYDGEGHRTEKFIDANADGVLDVGDTDVTQFSWDNRDRLTEVKTCATEGGDPTEVVDYLYDVENRWIGENIFNGTEHQIRFAYDGNEIVLQFDRDLPSTSGGGAGGEGSSSMTAADLSHRYTWLPGAVDQLMSDEQTDKVVWTVGDNQGTIRDLAVMDSGVTSVVNHRVFDSFGNLVSETNSAVDCLFGYTGRARDNATGLQNNLNRWYDASVGSWISKDPSGFGSEDANLYRYCGNNPLQFVDPYGLEKITIYIGGVKVAGGVGGHSFILVPDGKGGWTIYRGGPSGDNANTLKITIQPWGPQSIDYPKSNDKFKTELKGFKVEVEGGVAGANTSLINLASAINQAGIKYDPNPFAKGATCNSFTSWAIQALTGKIPALPTIFSDMGPVSWGGFRTPLPPLKFGTPSPSQ
jgi:RHS repeat-associated protein